MRKLRLPTLPKVALWACITGLLALGMFTTVVELMELPRIETKRANEQRQRFIINPLTGEVVLAGVTDAEGNPVDQFDVGTISTAPEAPKPVDATPSPEEMLPEGTPSLRTTPLEIDPAVPERSNDSLVPAPAPEVTEKVDDLTLPKRGDKDVLPSKLYARPFARTPEQILLGFVVLDAGIDGQTVGPMMHLPKEVTIAYSPYTRGNVKYAEQLRVLGHELWTMLPTMTSRYPNDDPGPMGLIAGMPQEETDRRMQQVLGAVPGSVGMVLEPDESFSQQKEAFAPVLDEIHTRGLLLLSTHPTRTTEQLSNKADFVSILRRADLILDPEANASQIRSKLAGVLTSATEKGEYLVVVSARPQTLEILNDWFKETTLPAPITLAPVSAFYQPKSPPVVAAPEEEGGHGKKEKPKPQPVKKQKVLPQDQYLKPAKEEGGGGGHH